MQVPRVARADRNPVTIPNFPPLDVAAAPMAGTDRILRWGRERGVAAMRRSLSRSGRLPRTGCISDSTRTSGFDQWAACCDDVLGRVPSCLAR